MIFCLVSRLPLVSAFGGVRSRPFAFLLCERYLPSERGRAPEFGLPTMRDGVPGSPGCPLDPLWSVRPLSPPLGVFGRGGDRSLSLYGWCLGLCERELPNGILVALSLVSVSLVFGGGGGSSFVFIKYPVISFRVWFWLFGLRGFSKSVLSWTLRQQSMISAVDMMCPSCSSSLYVDRTFRHI